MSIEDEVLAGLKKPAAETKKPPSAPAEEPEAEEEEAPEPEPNPGGGKTIHTFGKAFADTYGPRPKKGA
jgi:hypothetical protein